MNTKTSSPNATTTPNATKKTTRRANAARTTPNTMQEIAMKTKKTENDAREVAPAQPRLWDSQFITVSNELRAELDAVKPHEVIVINVDIPAAVRTARSVLPVLDALRPRAAALGAEVDMTLYDRVGAFADLLQYAHGGWLAAQKSPDEAAQKYGELVVLRDFLVGWSQGLVASKLFTREFLDAIGTTTGFDNACDDMVALTSALRAVWPKIAGKTMIEAAHIDRGDALVRELSTCLAMRDGRGDLLTKRASDRQLAFTLFYKAYSEARSVVGFLRRRERDADKLVPSLYEGRGGSSRKQEEPSEDEPAKPANGEEGAKPAAPVARPAGT
jgi:hypothetical protein